MISKLHIPSYPLNRFIQSFYYYKDYYPSHRIERLLPDGNVQIIFELTGRPRYIYNNNTLEEIQACRNVWFAGIWTKPITIPSGRDSEMIIVQFHKGKAYPFISETMHALTNIVVDAELVFKNDILYLTEKLKNAGSIDEKFQILEKNLFGFYLNNLYENPFIDFAISKIITKPAHWRIREIADRAGYSQKHIIKLFKDHVGLTPKEFLKIIRFQKVIEDIEKQKTINWASIAADCGFYDQSHFISDFRTYSGYTPADYMKQRGEYLNYIPIL